MKSEIFAFRTRTGIYTGRKSGDLGAALRQPEQRFIKRVVEYRTNVVQLAGLTESAFTRKYKNKVYQHGQNRAASTAAFKIKKLSSDAPIHMHPNDNEHHDCHIVILATLPPCVPPLYLCSRSLATSLLPLLTCPHRHLPLPPVIRR